MSLTFDEATHTYRWGGRVVPSVTQVLADLKDWSMIPRDRLARAQKEGVAIHKMVEWHLQGALDIDGLPEWMRPRHAALERFLREHNLLVRSQELRLYHDRYRYAGTYDIHGELDGDPALIDVKRSLYGGRVTGLQLAAYNGLLVRDRTSIPEKFIRRFALQLKDDGNYSLVEFSNPADWGVFLACLTRHHFMEGT